MTFNEILEQLDEHFDLNELLDSNMSKELSEIDSLGHVEQVSSGGFDEDSYYESVAIQRTYHFTDHGIWIQLKGYFSSYGGTAYDECKEVFPVEKTIIIYE